jgi:hypothetical protein
LIAGPAKFHRYCKGFTYGCHEGEISRFYHLQPHVPNSVAVGRSLDKCCLEKGQSRNRCFVKLAEQGSTQANPDSKWAAGPVKKKPARNKASRAGKFAMNSQNQNMENLCGT